MAPRDAATPGAAERAIEILETVGREGPGITAKAIAAELSMSPAAAYRLLNSLVASSYLVRLPDLSGFALGRGTAELATAISPPLVCHAARTIVDELRAEIRFGVHLVSFGSAMRLTDTDPDNPIRDIVGFVREPRTSAAGRMFLDNRGDQRSVPGRPVTPTFEQGGIGPDVASMAVPVPHSERGGLLVAALMLTAPLARAPLLESHIPRLQRAALELQPLLS